MLKNAQGVWYLFFSKCALHNTHPHTHTDTVNIWSVTVPASVCVLVCVHVSPEAFRMPPHRFPLSSLLLSSCILPHSTRLDTQSRNYSHAHSHTHKHTHNLCPLVGAKKLYLLQSSQGMKWLALSWNSMVVPFQEPKAHKHTLSDTHFKPLDKTHITVTSAGSKTRGGLYSFSSLNRKK